MNTRDRRSRNTFWIDDRIVDEYGPLLEQYPFGADALAVYAVLARRADRDGESWERVKPMARMAATKERTFQRCIRLLELLGLVLVESCYFEGTNVQTSNRYTLLTPPPHPPEVAVDPATWPAPVRPVLFVTRGANRRHVADERRAGRAEPLSPLTGCRDDTRTGVERTPPPRPPDTPPGVVPTPQEGDTVEGNRRKERFDARQNGQTACRPGREDGPGTAGSSHFLPTFVIAEVGLTNRQVWAAALVELARRGDISCGDLEAWLRPAGLIGRDAETLVVGAPNAVSRDRIATRLLPAVRDAIGATIGVNLGVAVVVAETG